MKDINANYLQMEIEYLPRYHAKNCLHIFGERKDRKIIF